MCLCVCVCVCVCAAVELWPPLVCASVPRGGVWGLCAEGGQVLSVCAEDQVSAV